MGGRGGAKDYVKITWGGEGGGGQNRQKKDYVISGRPQRGRLDNFLCATLFYYFMKIKI